MSTLEPTLEDRLDVVIIGIKTVADALDAETSAREADVVVRDQENVSRDRSSKRVLIAAAVAALFGVIGIIVGGIGITRASSAEIKADSLIAARSVSREVTCVQANIQAAQHNKLADAFDQVLLIAVTPDPNHPRTPEQQAAADTFLMTSTALVVQARDPGRDCSPEGIATFYKDPGSG